MGINNLILSSFIALRILSAWEYPAILAFVTSVNTLGEIYIGLFSKSDQSSDNLSIRAKVDKILVSMRTLFLLS